MIYVTGDCHSNFQRFNTRNFPEQKNMTKKDYVLICGDFGSVWNKGDESKEEKSILDWLNTKPFTTLFVDGNHENFDRLYEYPVEKWQGGTIHRVRPSIFHLMRGQVLDIDGRKIFTFGGAASHDIDGGILEPDDSNYRQKKKELDREGILYRINHITWWAQELPSEEEMKEGIRNLAKHDYNVDFVVTHCCPSDILAAIGDGTYQPDYLTDYLAEIKQKISYKKWFFGHYHNNKNVSEKEILLYEQVIRIL